MMAAALLLLLLLLLLASGAATAGVDGNAAPSGLMADFQGGTALGVSAAPVLSWIVPPCGASSRGQQSAYRVTVAEEKLTRSGVALRPVWDSGKVASNASANVLYAGPALTPGTVYTWNVTTWTIALGRESGACQSAPSEPARMITALFGGWDKGARWIWPANASTARFTYLRRALDVGSGSGSTCTHSGAGAAAAGDSGDSGGTAPVRALLFASATVDPVILSAFKIYLGGTLVAIGPGRGEAPVRGGNGHISRTPYTTLDVTQELVQALGAATSTVLAVEGQSPISDDGKMDMRWDSYDPYIAAHPPPKDAAVLVQLQITRADASTCTVVSGDSGWAGRPVDEYYNPFKNHGVWYNNPIENIDARNEPKGWRTELDFDDDGWSVPVHLASIGFEDLLPKMSRPIRAVSEAPRQLVPVPDPKPDGHAEATCSQQPAQGATPYLKCPAGEVIEDVVFAAYGSPQGSCATGFKVSPTCDAPGARVLAESLCLGKPACAVTMATGFSSTLKPPYNTSCGANLTFAIKVRCGKHEKYVVDFGQEIQGGVVLSMTGTAGHRVKIAAGELMGEANDEFNRRTNVTAYDQWLGTTDYVGQTWGYEFTWTMRDGSQSITQHNYQNFRYLELTFLDGPRPSDLSVGAWSVAYEWVQGQSAFSSSNATLDRVWKLCADTLRYVVLDTYTDSNTRERRPYESDGMIAAQNRGLLQRDHMWQRHSASWVLEYPTWPIEWQQQTPMLALDDWMATGTADLAEAYSERLLNDTKASYIDGTGVVGKVPQTMVSSSVQSSTTVFDFKQ